MNIWDEKSFEWQLTPDSVVFEIGGYEGRWVSEMDKRYGSKIHVFEPQAWACERMETKFAGSQNITIHSYGLGVETGGFLMGEFGTDGCSFTRTTRETSTGKLMEIVSFLNAWGIKRIDLCLMNIEGYEFLLLPHMLDKNILPDRLMVQFHPVGEAQQSLYLKIRKQLAEHYRLLWDFDTVLSAWELFNAPTDRAH